MQLDLKFIDDIFQRWTTSRNTKKATSGHVDGLHKFFSQLFQPHAPPTPYTQSKKKCARFEEKCNFIIIHQTFSLIIKHFGKLTIIGGWLLSTNPLKPYWIPNIDFTPYTSNDITICIIILPQMGKCIGTKIQIKFFLIVTTFFNHGL